jgi:divalent metal cation (Fe/Co/Zn/Cd) transporter
MSSVTGTLPFRHCGTAWLAPNLIDDRDRRGTDLGYRRRAMTDRSSQGATSPDRQRLERRGLVLEYSTIAWNVAEIFVAIGLGVAAGSLALVAFGLDSMVEVFASVVVVWHLRHPDGASDRISARALRLVSIAFFALAVVLIAGVVWSVVQEYRPGESPLGVVYLAATALVMFGLAAAKRRVGVGLASDPLRAEARMTFLDGVLATGVLLSLMANAVLGWWWADVAATLLVAAAAFAEGTENWQEAKELS